MSSINSPSPQGLSGVSPKSQPFSPTHAGLKTAESARQDLVGLQPPLCVIRNQVQSTFFGFPNHDPRASRTLNAKRPNQTQKWYPGRQRCEDDFARAPAFGRTQRAGALFHSKCT